MEQNADNKLLKRKGNSIATQERRRSAEVSSHWSEADVQRKAFHELHSRASLKKSRSEYFASAETETRKPLLYEPNIDYNLQLIIIGDRNVGKTCFLERYTGKRFVEESKSTVGIDFKMKNIVVAGNHVRLQIWDTAGQERFNSITTAYYRNAQGVVLVYDVTRPESYNNLSTWLNLLHEYGRNDTEIAIVGNKADLPDPQVDSHKARNFAEHSGYLFYETSAKDSLNVDTVFINLVYKILKQVPQPYEQNPRVRRKATPQQSLNDCKKGKVKHKPDCC